MSLIKPVEPIHRTILVIHKRRGTLVDVVTGKETKCESIEAACILKDKLDKGILV